MYEQNSVEFMGVLIDRQYRTGQKYVQLVFETAEGIRLSVSRNINLIRSLQLGSTYQVTGSERTVGQKRYIHEPTAVLVPENKFSLISKHYKILVPAAIGLVVLLSGVGVLTYAAQSDNNASDLPATRTEKPAPKSTPKTVTSTPSASIDSSAAQEQDNPTPVPPAKKRTPVSSTPNTTTPVVSSVVTTPVTNNTETNTPSIPNSPEVTTPVVTPPVTESPEEPQTPVEPTEPGVNDIP